MREYVGDSRVGISNIHKVKSPPTEGDGSAKDGGISCKEDVNNAAVGVIASLSRSCGTTQ